MRQMKDLTRVEIEHINSLVGYHCGSQPFDAYHNIKYCLFDKTKAAYSGEGCIKVYLYLKSIGIDWLDDK